MPEDGTTDCLSQSAIGGWLLFFVISSYLGCISLALQVMRPAPLERTLLLIMMFVTTFTNAILAGMRSDLIFVSLWVHFGMRLIVTIANLRILWAIRDKAEFSTTQDLFNQAGAVIIAILWLLYFRRSRRVRIAFGKNL